MAGKREWIIDLNSLLEKTMLSDHIFLNSLFVRKNQILLFSYCQKDASNNSYDLYYWTFKSETGGLIQKNSLGQFQEKWEGTSIDPWEINDVLSQDNDSVIITRKQKKNLILEKYLWDDNSLLKKQWSINLSEHLDKAIDYDDIFLHSKIIFDGSLYRCILQISGVASQKVVNKSYLINIDKINSKVHSISLINDSMMVEDWELFDGSLVFSLQHSNSNHSNGILLFDKSKEKSIWQYFWKNSENAFTDVRFVNRSIILQTNIRDINQKINLRLIDHKGNVVSIKSFADSFKESESFSPGTYIPSFDLFPIPQNNEFILIITNRGYIYLFDIRKNEKIHTSP